MKAYLLVVAVAVLPACGKQNDVAVLEHEAASLATYYQPKVHSLDERLKDLLKRGEKIPGVEDVVMRAQEARTTINTLRGIVGDPGQESPLAKQAESVAKEGKVEELERLVHDNETALSRGVLVVNSNLDTVEGWMDQYQTKTLAKMPPPLQPEQGSPEQPAQPAPEGVNPAQPTPAPAPAPSQPAPKK